MDEKFPTSLIQETLEAANMYHGLCHRGITFILIGRSAIQHIGVYDVYLGVPFHSIA